MRGTSRRPGNSPTSTKNACPDFPAAASSTIPSGQVDSAGGTTPCPPDAGAGWGESMASGTSTASSTAAGVASRSPMSTATPPRCDATGMVIPTARAVAANARIPAITVARGPRGISAPRSRGARGMLELLPPGKGAAPPITGRVARAEMAGGSRSSSSAGVARRCATGAGTGVGVRVR